MKTYKIFMLAAFFPIVAACSKTEESIIGGSDANIISCTVTIGDITIEGSIEGKYISVPLPGALSGENISVRLELSEKATVQPDPSTVEDWEGEHIFTVTSANRQSENEYTLCIFYSDKTESADYSVRIGNQADLESFAANGYTEIASLMLYDDNSGDPITDLSGLESIKTVRTEIEVRNIGAKEIRFPSLEYLGNFDLLSPGTEIISMPELRNVAGRFRVGNDDPGPMPEEHPSLKSIDLPSLESIGRSFIVFLCTNLEEINTPNLRYVGEDIYLLGGKITTPEFMKNITRVNGSLTLNSGLESLEGFNVREISSGLVIDLDECPSLEPLSAIEKVSYINLSNGMNIESFKGLENLDLEAIDVKTFPKIRTLEYLPLKNGMKHIQINGFESLESLDGFEGIDTVDELYLQDCAILPDIDDLAGLENVTILNLALLEGLTRMPDFQNLTEVKGALTISMMSKLTDITGLRNIVQVGSLRIDNLLALPDLNGLNNLKQITDGGLAIGNLPLVTNLDELSNLENVNMPEQSDIINITMNKELVSYCGVRDLLIRHWNDAGGKLPKVSITGNKYNPTYEQLVNGECVMP